MVLKKDLKDVSHCYPYKANLQRKEDASVSLIISHPLILSAVHSFPSLVFIKINTPNYNTKILYICIFKLLYT